MEQPVLMRISAWLGWNFSKPRVETLITGSSSRLMPDPDRCLYSTTSVRKECEPTRCLVARRNPRDECWLIVESVMPNPKATEGRTPADQTHRSAREDLVSQRSEQLPTRRAVRCSGGLRPRSGTRKRIGPRPAPGMVCPNTDAVMRKNYATQDWRLRATYKTCPQQGMPLT